jgi:hypothetical protein
VGAHPASDLPALLRRCLANDEVAWEECYACIRRVSAGILSRFQNLSPVERELAGDNARANLVSAILESRIEGGTNGEILGFFRTVVTNCAHDAWRARHPAVPLPPTLEDHRTPSPFEAARSKAQLDCVHKVVQSWGADDRFLFIMKVNGVTTATIKTDLERRFHVFISSEAVDTRCHRLREQLRQRCERKG